MCVLQSPALRPNSERPARFQNCSGFSGRAFLYQQSLAPEIESQQTRCFEYQCIWVWGLFLFSRIETGIGFKLYVVFIWNLPTYQYEWKIQTSMPSMPVCWCFWWGDRSLQVYHDISLLHLWGGFTKLHQAASRKRFVVEPRKEHACIHS